ncbi:hypothetical protein GCM10010313_37700 [Streptomyces violarus]|nr:hypothetical protein GCM10010313_37700 [Streptomyces violarus]
MAVAARSTAMTSDTAYSHPYGYSGDEPCARDPQDDEEPDDGAELAAPRTGHRRAPYWRKNRR